MTLQTMGIQVFNHKFTAVPVSRPWKWTVILAMVALALAIGAMALSGTGSASASDTTPSSTIVVLTFDEVVGGQTLGGQERIAEFYDGGFSTARSSATVNSAFCNVSPCSGPGPDYDIVFADGGLALCDADEDPLTDAICNAYFANEPSSNSALLWVTSEGTPFVVNHLSGFTTGFSFYNTSFAATGTVRVYDGLNGTGNLLATIDTVAEGSTSFCGASGDPTPVGGFRVCWTNAGADFSGTAHDGGQEFIDNMTFGLGADADGDLVSDPNDDCSGTPSGAIVDANGCSDLQVDADLDGFCDPGAPSVGPSICTGTDAFPNDSSDHHDSDGDGVGDNSDDCSGTPSSTAVDANGCSQVQLDALDDDGDTVSNSNDDCSGTPSGAIVDANGCSDLQVDADLDGFCDPGAPSVGPSICFGTDDFPNDATENHDSDGDGVGDNSDLCPLTPTGEPVDEVGDANPGCSESQLNQSPVAVAQNVTVAADFNCLGTVSASNINDGSFDPDGDPITLSIYPPGPFNLGDTNVTLTVSDGTAQSTANAVVTLVDDSDPVLTAPGGKTVTENVPGGWSGPIGTPTGVADNCDGNPTITNNALAVFPLGDTTVTWTATDDTGNFATDTQVITVNSLDSDGDGVNDDVDPFVNSDRGPTVVIDGCDSEVTNEDLGDGSTMNDRIVAISARNHGDFLKQLNEWTNKWKKEGLLTKSDKGKITACA